jgi:hypothetical protein
MRLYGNKQNKLTLAAGWFLVGAAGFFLSAKKKIIYYKRVSF